MSLKMKRTRKFPIGRYTPVVSVSILVLSLISIPAFAQQTNFIASLSGQAMSPTISTTATGTAKFKIEPDGNMAYQIDTRNINGVIGAHISLKNGTDLAQVFNSYTEINGKPEIPNGEVNGNYLKELLHQVILAVHLQARPLQI